MMERPHSGLIVGQIPGMRMGAGTHPTHPVSHTDHVIFVVERGARQLELGGLTVRASAGAVVLLPAGLPHRSFGDGDVEAWCVAFCASCLQLREDQLLMSAFRRIRGGALPVAVPDEARQPRLARLCTDLYEESERGAPESRELVRSLLLLLLGEVHRAMPGPDYAAQRDSLVSDALEFIRRECLTPISLKDVAAAVHKSPAHLTTTVKAETGHTVGEWIRAGRLSEACSRLAHTDDSLEEVSTAVGWKDATQLIRQFRRAYGVTPAAWRRDIASAHTKRSIT
ncbi:MAG: AraC family transcriptional regulator [Nannocystaceae bacterium]|nr:AraC family transcriptional regulator [Nannocystaceae bacterium]